MDTTGHVEQGPVPEVALSCEGQLSPRLRNALEGLDSNVQDLMVREGITTHVVIANNWDSPQELVADFWKFAPSTDLEVLWAMSEGMCSG